MHSSTKSLLDSEEILLETKTKETLGKRSFDSTKKQGSGGTTLLYTKEHKFYMSCVHCKFVLMQHPLFYRKGQLDSIPKVS